MNLVFDIYPALTPRGTRLVRLSKSHLGPGSGFRKELVGLGEGTIVINAHQAEATAANFTLDNYVEVIDLDLGDPIDGESLGAFFLEEGDFTAVSADEQSGRMLTFTGRGELAYLDRGILGPDALADYAGPFDQYILDTEGLWRWGATPTATETYGGVLRRIIYESCLLTPNPHPEVLPSGDINWNDITDSDGNAWPVFTSNYDIEIGTNLLDAIGELLTNGIELIGNADFSYDAYVAGTYGTDRSSATFASGKVRFEAGVNIAADLERAVHGSALASHTIVVDATGASNDLVVNAGYGGVVKYVGIRAPQQSGPDDLEALGENILRNRNEFADQFSFPHPPGEAPLSGLYTPGPPGGEGHYWVGDTVTIHTGTGPYDANEQAIRVAAIEWGIDDAGNWLPTVELGAQYLSVAGAGFSNQLTTMVSRPHTHPPNPQLCRPSTVSDFAAVASMGAVCSSSGSNFDSEVVADAKVERVDLTTTLAAAAGQSIVVITGSQNNAATTGVWDSAGNTYVKAAEHGDSAGAPNPRAAIWYTNVSTPLALGATIHYEVGVGSSLSAGLETGGKCISAYLFDGGLYTPAESGTNAVVNGTGPSVVVGGADLIVAAGEENGGASGFPDTITLDADWTAFDGAATVASSADSAQIWGGFRIGDSGGETYSATIDQARDWAMVGATFSTGLSAGGANDGHPDLVGTSIRASRCDHRHDLHRDAEPTATDDEDAGYHVGVVWAVLDDLVTPTAIESVWVLVDATGGAAVWLEWPGGAGGGTTIEVEDEGSNEGSVDTLNFTGAGVSVTVTGSEAEVIIPGGGTSDWDATIIKSSDQTVTNNATPQDDTQLQFSVTASSLYLIEFYIFYSGNNTTGDYQWQLTYPALAFARQALGQVYILGASDAPNISSAGGIGASTTKWPSATLGLGVDAIDSIFSFHGRLTLTTGAAGTLKAQFANSAAASGRTSTTRAGSMIRYRKLA